MIKEKIGNYASLCLKYLQIVARRYVDDGCRQRAAALTYMTLAHNDPHLSGQHSNS